MSLNDADAARRDRSGRRLTSPRTSSRLAKVARLAECFSAADGDEVGIAVAYLSGVLAAGLDRRRLGGAAGASRAGDDSPTARAARGRRGDVPHCRRPPARARRRRGVTSSWRCSSRATEQEQRFLDRSAARRATAGRARGCHRRRRRESSGDTRRGRAPRRDARRRPDRRCDEGAAQKGRAGSTSSGSRCCARSLPMLAQTAADVGAALEQLRYGGSVEWKLDGARIQAHRLGDEARAFTRNLADVTDRAPEIARPSGAPGPGVGPRRGGRSRSASGAGRGRSRRR